MLNYVFKNDYVKQKCNTKRFHVQHTAHKLIYTVAPRYNTTHYNAVGRGPRISAPRGKMGATTNNNAVINCHLFLWSPHVCLVQVYLETI